MLKNITYIILCMIITQAVVADEASNPHVRDLLVIADWFEGEFDNEEQLWFHRRSEATGEPPTRIHVTNTRIDAPAFGAQVFYTEEYFNNDPTDIARQRLVVLSTSVEHNAIRMQQGFFKQPEKFKGAHQDPSKFKNLSAKDVLFLDECDLWVRRKADQYEGSMLPKQCVFGEGDKRRYSVHDIVLSAGKFWRTDATFLLADDSFYKGTPLQQPTQLRRANIFICSYYFDGEDGTQQVVDNLRVHSQGGTASAVRKSDGQAFEILIREKEYPFYSDRPDFTYYSIRKAGELRSVAYGVSDTNTRQFGTRAGAIGAFCHRDGFTFQQHIEEL